MNKNEQARVDRITNILRPEFYPGDRVKIINPQGSWLPAACQGVLGTLIEIARSFPDTRKIWNIKIDGVPPPHDQNYWEILERDMRHE